MIRLLDAEALHGFGLTAPEADIAAEAANMLTCKPFNLVVVAHANGYPVEVVVSGIAVVYEPSLPQTISGMTLFAENGFVMGPAAFSSGLETVKAMLHELYRLKTSLVGRAGTAIAGPMVTVETTAAHRFADKAATALISK